MTVNRNSPQTLVAQVEDDLRRRIRSAEFGDSGRLPAVRALMNQYSVSNATVQEALRTLQRENLIASAGNRGNFVRGQEGPADQFDELDEIRSRLDQIEQRLASGGL